MVLHALAANTTIKYQHSWAMCAYRCFDQVHYFWILILTVVLLIVVESATADEPMYNKDKIEVGGYTLSRNNTTLSLTATDVGAGLSVNPEEAFGLKTEQTVIRVDGAHRFNKQHSLTYSWYRTITKGAKSVEKEFDWVDENGDPITIPIGARIDTSLDYNTIKLGYLWSFYHSSKVEVAVGAGLHVTRVAVELISDTTSSGAKAKSVKTTLPLPVATFAFSYRVTPKFGWYWTSEFFALSFDEWEGTFTEGKLAMEYKLFNKIGVGIGIGNNSLTLTEKTSDYRFDYKNRISGVMFYLSGYIPNK